MGYGRAYFGMHYPSDILGGAIIGSLSSALIYSLRVDIIKFKNRILKEENKPDQNISKNIAGLYLGELILTSFFNDFIFSSDKYQINYSLSTNNSPSVGLSIHF